MGKIANFAVEVALFAVACVPGAAITAGLRGYVHPEYHFNGNIGGQQVVYQEKIPFTIDVLGTHRYGVLEVKNPDGSVALYASDNNNNLRLDNRDTITIRGTDGKEVKFKIDTSNQNVAELVRGLQPKMDSTLAQILAANTAAVR